MKKILYFSLLLIMATSCIKDDSTLWEREVETIKIFSNTRTLNLMLNEEFTFKADSVVITNPDGTTRHLDMTDDNYEYYWRQKGSYYDSDVPGETISADYEITHSFAVPMSSSYIDFNIYDKSTGLTYNYWWYLNVNSQLNNGLVVCDTEDGVTGRFNQVGTPYISANYSDDVRLFTDILKDKFEGESHPIISDVMVYYEQYADPITQESVILTDKGDIHVFDKEFNIFKTKNEVFIDKPEDKLINFINSKGNRVFVSESGKLYRMINWMIGVASATTGGLDYNIQNIVQTHKYDSNVQLAYDKLNDRVWMYSPAGILQRVIPTANNSSLNFDNTAGYDCLYMGIGNKVGWYPTAIAIMKNESDNSLRVETLEVGSTGAPLYATTLTRNSYPITVANSKIIDAQFITSTNKGDNIFYLNNNEIYALNIKSGSQEIKQDFTIPAGETVTHFFVRNGQTGGLVDYRDLSGEKQTVASQGRLLIVATYSVATNKGKLYLIPIRSTLDPQVALESEVPYVQIVEGFGKITTITTTNEYE